MKGSASAQTNTQQHAHHVKPLYMRPTRNNTQTHTHTHTHTLTHELTETQSICFVSMCCLWVAAFCLKFVLFQKPKQNHAQEYKAKIQLKVRVSTKKKPGQAVTGSGTQEPQGQSKH